MTELELYKYINDNNIEWHRQDNMKNKTSITHKLGISLLVAVFISSCESKCDVQKTIDELKKERTKLQTENANLISLKSGNYSDISRLNEKIKELKIYESGSIPQYFIKLHFTPTTLRITNAAINSFSLELPVDKRFYESHNAGDSYGRMRIESKWVAK
jgi:hypothetical protein